MLVFTATDRPDEALDVADQAIVAAQRDRQNWALNLFETWKGQHCSRWDDLRRRPPCCRVGIQSVTPTWSPGSRTRLRSWPSPEFDSTWATLRRRKRQR